MSLDSIDEELRAATFAHLQRLRARFGDRIPARELSAGVTLRGERVPAAEHFTRHVGDGVRHAELQRHCRGHAHDRIVEREWIQQHDMALRSAMTNWFSQQ